MNTIYLDHAATTPLDPRVKAVVDRLYEESFGNPSSFHTLGLRAKHALNDARAAIAKILGAKAEEIIFTSGGTESVNLALKGVARAAGRAGKGRHIITSAIEHPAVLESCKALVREGFEISYLEVDRHGIVAPESLKKAIRADTVLISIMYANNEIGTIEPIKELAAVARSHGIPFHTDACQAAPYLELDVNTLGVDLMTINSSKCYGPKGVGALFVRSGVELEPIIHGGGQEFGFRSGTENVPGIVGFAKALELCQAERIAESKRLAGLRDKLISGIVERIPKSFLNGHPTQRLPNNVNITILDVEGESLVLHLNELGICASTGSACSSHKLEPSHVITALGLPHEASHGSLRFTLGRETTDIDIERVLSVLPGIVEALREISPVRLDPAKVLGVEHAKAS